MKRVITLIAVLAIAISVPARSGILVAQFGTSNDEGRKASLDVLYTDLQSAFPEYDIREAYTSPTIRRILAKRGVNKDSVTDALLRMHLDGIDTVMVQPTFLLDGVEMQMLRDEVAAVTSLFSNVRIGVPLLYTIDDFKALAAILSAESPARREAIMYVGHGNEYASTSAYAMLGSMLQHAGSSHSYIGTIEGWPDLQASVAQLTGKGYRKVTLVPLLLAAGVHAREDIDGEWRPAVESIGCKAEVRLQGLGERQAIRQMVIDHLRQLQKSI